MPVINNLNMLYVRDSSGKFVPVPALVGEPGKDGKSPKIRLYNASIIEGGGYIVEVEDVDGNVSRVQVQDGKDGASGNGISSVVLNDDYTLTLLFTNGTEYTTSSIRGAAGAAGEDGVDGKDGKDGEDGVSIVSVEQTTTSTEDEGTNTIVVTLSSGQTEAFQIRNGSKGREGESGVYVGSGTPPDGTRVQIDPDGEEIELLTIDDIPEIATQAAGMVDVGGVVKITEQTFTDDEKAQARSNIGAANASDVSELSDNIADKLSINQGAANVGKILVVGTDGNITLADMPSGGVSGDVVGVLDDSNNILLSGDLADGTYTIKYEMEDGSTIDIGQLVLDNNVYYTVTNNLTNCTNNNSKTEVTDGESYSATISANDGYELSSVVVTMGGSSVSVSSGVINIASVTGDIIITAVAEEVQTSGYTNLADPTSSDWQEGYRLSLGSGGTSALDGHIATNFIPCVAGDTVRVKGLWMVDISDNSLGSSSNCKIVTYDSNKALIAGLYGSMGVVSIATYGNKVTVDGDVQTYTVMIDSTGTQIATDKTAYVRIDGKLMDGYTADDVIITINEEIV